MRISSTRILSQRPGNVLGCRCITARGGVRIRVYTHARARARAKTRFETAFAHRRRRLDVPRVSIGPERRSEDPAPATDEWRRLGKRAVRETRSFGVNYGARGFRSETPPRSRSLPRFASAWRLYRPVTAGVVDRRASPVPTLSACRYRRRIAGRGESSLARVSRTEK